MEKKKYDKPIVIELGDRAQTARGGPLACVSGSLAAGPWESCGTGTGAGWSCSEGAGVGVYAGSCIGGSSAAAGGDCFSGSLVSYNCGVGSGGARDPNGCRTGPSFI